MAAPPALASPPDDFFEPPSEPPPPESPPDFPPPEPPPELPVPPPQATSEAQPAPTPSAVPNRMNLSREIFSKTSSSLSPVPLDIRSVSGIGCAWHLSTPPAAACQHAPASGCRLSAFQLDPKLSGVRM